MEADELSVIMRELRRVIEGSVIGDIVELGCYTGTTSVFLAREIAESPRTLWLYDSFEGLPEKTDKDSSPAGYGFVRGELTASKAELERNFKRLGLLRPRIIKGWFSDISPKDLPESICFAFLDGDYYDSIRDSFALIHERLTPGATVVIDDYRNEKLPGAARAVDEFARRHSLNVRVEASLAILHL
jgi:O-methyltransferase